MCGVEEQNLLGIITMAVATGIRKSEITELRWDRVDLSGNVLRLEVTESGRRREVPVRDVVYRPWPSGPATVTMSDASGPIATSGRPSRRP